MSRSLLRRILAFVGAGLTSVLVASAVAAHPLGNATVSRAVRVEVGTDRVAVTAVVDMAEIPAFSAFRAMDVDGDGATEPLEAAEWAADRCAERAGGLLVEWDEAPLGLDPAGLPKLTFPPGVGGLETLRLECTFEAEVDSTSGQRHAIAVADAADDGHLGWREVTIIAGDGVAIVEADVPAVSPTALLAAYPSHSLEAPQDVRSGTALIRAAAPPAATAEGTGGSIPGLPIGDPLVSLLDGTAGGGWLGTLLAIALSVGLGAAHGLSPGHGKVLVAASLIGSRGSARQAMWLALAVGASHTTGVLVLGGLVLGAGTLLAPDLVLAWLSLAAGACVVLVGATMVIRRAGRDARRPHRHGHHHGHGHDHDDPHAHRGAAAHLGAGSIVALGLVGGLVPSTSALIVLLIAITTGQVALGLALIVGFGLGMAAALGAVALGSIAVGRRFGRDARQMGPVIRRLVAAVPVLSGVAVLIAGVAMTIGALDRVL